MGTIHDPRQSDSHCSRSPWHHVSSFPYLSFSSEMRGSVLQRTQFHCSPRQSLLQLPLHITTVCSERSRVGLVKCTTVERDVGATTKMEDDKNGHRRIPVAPFKIVITGSTKGNQTSPFQFIIYSTSGLGFELAREFLKAGDDVVLSSRNCVSLFTPF